MFNKKFTVSLADKTVECQTYTMRDYTKLILSKTESTSELMKKAYSEILEKCTNARNLSKHEAEFLLVHLLAKSEHQHEPSQDHTCDCGHTQNVKINLDHMYIDYGDAKIDELYSLGKFKIGLKWPALWADDNIGHMISTSIDAIYANDEKIGIDELSEVELDDLYEAITESHMNYIKKILIAPKPALAIPVKCDACGKRHVHIIKGFKEFTRLL